VISTDEDVVSDATANGAEPANSSSGALTALNKFGANGSGIGVAIIDSGIANVSIKDLDNVVYNVDFINNTINKHIDGFGHGTHVAGILGGSGDASGANQPYAGVAPGVRLIDH
jgi:serine protease AprX